MSDCGNVKKVFVPTKDQEPEKIEEQKKTITGVEISDLAAQKIVHFATVDGKSPDEYGLRIEVIKDGCSGSSYNMDLGSIKEAEENGDRIFQKDGASIIVAKLSYMFVIGSILDYKETLLASGFELRNPNVTAACSCGSSVSFTPKRNKRRA
jgi:iron-sulfur cluster assembly protein